MFPAQDHKNELLKEICQPGIVNYSIEMEMPKINFMQFPEFARCSFIQPKRLEKVA